MAQWTNEYAILRDLSVAQGRVPVAIERTVGAGDKPPTLIITEDTEEEFFKHCSADANVSTAPDYGLIQKMLDMVRDEKEWPDEDDTDKAVVISKLKPQCSAFIPNQKDTSTPNDGSPINQIKGKPKKRQRNVAVESILQAIAESSKQNNEVILLKPNDFIAKNLTKPKPTDNKMETQQEQIAQTLQLSKDIAEGYIVPPTAEEKVNGWLTTQTGSPFPKKTIKVTLEATNIVFKKKEKLNKYPTQYLKKLESSMSSSSNSSEYKPSKLATEYYLKYTEQSKFKQSVKEDIWTKAEKKMKDIEEKRQLNAAQGPTSSFAKQALGFNQSFEETQSTDSFTARIVAETKISCCLELVGLPQHRHRLTGNCIVCQVMVKKLKNAETNVFKNHDNRDILNNIEFQYSINNGVVMTKNNSKENAGSSGNQSAEPNDDSTAGLTDNVKITELTDNELAKFVDNADMNRQCTEVGEQADLKLYERSEEWNSDIDIVSTLDMQNVYDYISKTELSLEEAGISDKSF